MPMSFLDGLKTNWYERNLKQQLDRSRQPRIRPFKAAEIVGILFDADREEERAIVLNYRNILERDYRKKVTLLGYHDVKELIGARNYDCFCRKQLDWSETPKIKEGLLAKFVQTNFHWLLALHMKDCPPLEYLAAASSAEFRVGHYRAGKTDFYDWMLHGKDQSLRDFIRQMEDYKAKIR